ncbi:S8 family serine peptidase [Microcoleus vaginatus ZQ-A3]
MATPHVAGVAALVLNTNPILTPAQVEYILTTTANPNGIIA